MSQPTFILLIYVILSLGIVVAIIDYKFDLIDKIIFNTKTQMETTAELRKRFDDLFLEKFEDIKEEHLKENVSFDQLGIDSMDKLEFQFELEKEFDVDLADDLDALRKPVDMFNNLVGALEKQ